VEKANPTGFHTIQFHLYSIPEMTELQMRQISDCQELICEVVICEEKSVWLQKGKMRDICSNWKALCLDCINVSILGVMYYRFVRERSWRQCVSFLSILPETSFLQWGSASYYLSPPKTVPLAGDQAFDTWAHGHYFIFKP
jgi:hypothetical protein